VAELLIEKIGRSWLRVADMNSMWLQVGKLLGSEELHWRSNLNKKFSSFVQTMHVLLTTTGSDDGPELVEWSKPAG